MRIAIYSRKSKYTGKGESIGNQIQFCLDYLSSHFASENIVEILKYEDEGYSGGDTERPHYQDMIKDAKARKFDVLICYRLDRISRNVSDFSSLIDMLKTYDISFISIRERFDTTTPMGRAMMYIASVFAQLERDTIAERIRDNMLELAKTGRWLGGTRPTGFSSKALVNVDINGKERKAYKLNPISGELAVVTHLFQSYIEVGSLTKLETYCLQNNILSKNSRRFSRDTLKEILENPVYAVADHAIYDYLNANGYEIYSPIELFDGVHGLLAYNKTLQKKHTSVKSRNKSEWIVAVGKHKGVIPSSLWIHAQELLQQNKSKSYRKVKNSDSLLSGLLHCSSCGSYMRPRTTGRVNKEGKATYYYMCELKEKSHRQLCSMKNVLGNDVDQFVIDKIKQLSESNSALDKQLNNDIAGVTMTMNTLKSEEESLRAKIQSNEQAIKRLVDSMADGEQTEATKYIIAKINELDKDNNVNKQRLVQLHEEMESDVSDKDYLATINSLLSSFSASVDILSVPELRNLLRNIVSRVEWDGSDVCLELFAKKK